MRVLVLLILLLALLLSACGQAPDPAAHAAATLTTPTPEPGIPVEVALAQKGNISLLFDYTGSLEPKDKVNLAPGVGGRVQAVLVEEGDEVQAGDPIAIIEGEAYAAQLKQAEAALTRATLEHSKMKLGARPEQITAAQAALQLARAALNDVVDINDNERTKAAAELARAEAALRLAQSDYDKIAWAGDVGQTPQALALERATIAYEDSLAKYTLDTNPSDVQVAPLMLQVAQAELNLALTLKPYREVDFEIAKANIEQAEAVVELARIQLDHATLTAPFDGVIATVNLEQGSMASAQTPAVKLISKEVEVVVDVQENRIGQIFKGQSVSVQTTAYPGVEFPAQVSSIAPTANEDTHTFTVKITPQDAEGKLRSGMYARLSILAEEREGTLLVPRSAVISLGDRDIVYVVTEDNLVQQRDVTVGLSDNDKAEILAGLEEDDAVITAGQSNLTGGAKVEVVDDPRIAE